MAGPETVECSNCGKEIRLTADVCHNCGWDNDKKPGRKISTTHDPENIETTVSENWYYGIVLALLFWILSFITSGISEPVSGFLMLIGWILLPVSAFYDMSYIRANSKWNPSTGIWIIGFLIPLINLVLSGIYLYRRHETIGIIN